MPRLHRTKIECPTTETYAARVRQQATQAIKLYLQDTPALVFEQNEATSINPVVDALFRLRHLEPGQTEAAIWCHSVLVRKIKSDLDRMGLLFEGADLIQSSLSFLDSSGWWYIGGRWTSREEKRAKMQVTA
jgi:hypothetical protein